MAVPPAPPASRALADVFRVPRVATIGRADWAQLVRFCLVGGTGYVLNLVVFGLLVHGLGAGHIAAALAAFVVAWSNNFVLNKFWTFRRHSLSWLAQGARYLTVSLVALALNLVVLELLVRADVAKLTAQAVAIALVTPVNFLLNRRWSFR